MPKLLGEVVVKILIWELLDVTGIFVGGGPPRCVVEGGQVGKLSGRPFQPRRRTMGDPLGHHLRVVQGNNNGNNHCLPEHP